MLRVFYRGLGFLLIIVSVNKNRMINIKKSDDGFSELKIGNKKVVDGAVMGYGKAFWIGVAQVFALIPGISRSGATISSGILLGLSEKNAMRFSFLLAIPVIFWANILSIGNNTLTSNLIWATLVSFIIGLLTIHLVFTKFLIKRKNFRWFGAYCLLLAFGLLVFELIF